MRPLVIDTFPVHDELDLLECRLVEIYDSVDYFVAVEAEVTHQDNPKPWYVTDNLSRFSDWKDKLIVVQAKGLPTAAEDPNPWARELAQRGYVQQGLDLIGVKDDDIILHGDVDEIPRGIFARGVRPKPGLVVPFHQRLHCFAVDWLHPDPWYGTVAFRAGMIPWLAAERPTAMSMPLNAFARARDKRNGQGQPHTYTQEPLVDAGWHLSWLGGQERAFHKLGAFCHPEVRDRIEVGLRSDQFMREGQHVDGRKMAPVEVDDSWPRWIVEGHAPESWFRPR
jgi:hypothetical protein